MENKWKNAGDIILPILFGLFLLYRAYSELSVKTLPEKLISTTITLRENPKLIHNNDDEYYALLSQEYATRFIIAPELEFVNALHVPEELKMGDTVQIQYSAVNEGELENKESEIELVFLKYNKKLFFDSDTYVKRKTNYATRVGILCAVGGVLILLLSVPLIKRKTVLIAGGVIVLLLFIYFGLENHGMV